MNVACQNVLDAEAFRFFASRKRVTDAVRALQRAGLDNGRTMETVASCSGPCSPPETILCEANLRVTEVHQPIRHLDAKRQNASHDKRSSIAPHDFVGQVHQAPALPVDSPPFISEPPQ